MEEIGCAIYMLLSTMLESLIVSACVVEVCGIIVSATSDLHIVVNVVHITNCLIVTQHSG